MSDKFADKVCEFRCRLEDLIEEYAECRASERVATAMLPLIECWKELDSLGTHMRMESMLTDDDLREWVAGLRNADGSAGGHWTEAQTTAVGDSIGIKWGDVSPKCWNAVMNMMYSDYSPIADKYKLAVPDFYAELSKAFLWDKDGGGAKRKLAGYYAGVVKPARKG